MEFTSADSMVVMLLSLVFLSRAINCLVSRAKMASPAASLSPTPAGLLCQKAPHV